jgi:GNAT superfamily N-acetyltransferase
MVATSMTSPIRIAPDRLDSPVGAPLVRAQWLELLERYGIPDADPDGLTADHLAPPDGIFLVAWRGEEPVACGGVRRYDASTGEIKRMYTKPEARRHGISRRLLIELEARAQSVGYTRLVLETGVRQPEAIALYVAEGYEPVEPYGFYRDAPGSRCFAKTLR